MVLVVSISQSQYPCGSGAIGKFAGATVIEAFLKEIQTAIGPKIH